MAQSMPNLLNVSSVTVKDTTYVNYHTLQDYSLDHQTSLGLVLMVLAQVKID